LGKLKNLATISREFNIDSGTLHKLGVVNVILNADTKLFIDPLLLPHSCHPEIFKDASETYNKRFEDIIKLLSYSTEKGDLPWRNAKKKFKFSEISWTCLGYSTGAGGSGFGKELVESTLDTAYQIVQLGIRDVDMFMALGLFEEGIGPDRISDMTTNIILNELISFTQRINKSLDLPVEIFKINDKETELPLNPHENKPLLLVPTDIVRDLPIASDYSDIARVARENEDLRERLNSQVGQIFASVNSKQKAILKDNALRSREGFEAVIELINQVPPEPYDLLNDKNGELFWLDLQHMLAERVERNSTHLANSKLTAIQVYSVVEEIINQFQSLIEDKGLWKQLWVDDENHKKERAAQGLFYAVAESYCIANDLDLTPEADRGNGPVDFKISQGAQSKVLVEIKLSSNGSVVHGYEKQLEIYKKADNTDKAFYLLLDVGYMGRKYVEIQNKRREHIEMNGHASTIVLVDATPKASASKR
jgi:hypothetical protein